MKERDVNDRAKRYSAPALEKGLEILELLAGEDGGLSQNQIAQRLGRSVNEIFRMLNCLEQFGYIYRRKPAELYYLTLKLFELGHRQPPLRRLLNAAQPHMRVLADETHSSCHLTVVNGLNMMVVAREDSPEPLSFIARLGSLYPITSIPAGRVMLAFQTDDVLQHWLTQLRSEFGSKTKMRAFRRRLDTIREQGYERADHETHQGIVGLSFPMCDSSGVAHAALTVPLMITRNLPHDVDAVIELVWRRVMAMSDALGWRPDSVFVSGLTFQRH